MTIPEQAGPAGGRLRFVGVLVPLGLILTAGGLLVEHSASRVSVIRAAVDKAPDADRDGLVDGLEHRLGTSAADADTDKDGFSDAEEIARRSSPRSAQSLPEHGLPIDVGIVAYGEGSMLHALFVVYAADGSLGDKHLTLSALIGEHPVRIPSDVVSRLGSLHTVPASRRPGKLFLLDVPILPRTVYAAGSLSLAASVAAPRTSLEASADTVDLIAMDEEIYLRLPWRRIGHAKLASENAPDSGSRLGRDERFHLDPRPGLRPEDPPGGRRGGCDHLRGRVLGVRRRLGRLLLDLLRRCPGDDLSRSRPRDLRRLISPARSRTA
jgi:hypothetical protein